MPIASWKAIVYGFGFALIACGSMPGQGVSFNSPKDYSVGRGPTAVVVADFNLDGNLDVAVTDESSGSVSVLLGQGNGNFKPALNSGAGVSPTAMAVGDFNHDGKPDLVVVDANIKPRLSILLGNGDGTFQKPIQVNLSSQPNSVAVGDFNGDGNLDVAIGLSDQVAIFLGNGDGTLQAPTLLNIENQPKAVVVADFNGDGEADLAVALSGSGQIAVLMGNGDGTFEAPTDFAAGGEVPNALAAGDFNHDGNLDLAILAIAEDSSQGDVSVLLGNGDGTFQTPISTGSFFVWFPSMVLGDFNNDGNLDVVTTGAAGTGLAWDVSLFAGNGDGTFRSPTAVTLGNIFGVGAGDFNNDGKLDVAGASYGVVEVRLNEGKGVFPSPKNYPTAGDELLWMVSADFNGDGALDLATADRDANGISILLGNGNGTFQAPLRFTTPGEPLFLAAGDFNGDGIPDIVVALTNISSSGPLEIFLGNGDGTFQPGQEFAADVDALQIIAGDFNNDGKLDLAVLNYSYVMIFLGNGDGTFQAPNSYIMNGGGAIKAMTVADFNGDEKLDVAAINGATLSIFLGNGDGTLRAPISGPWVPESYYITAADLNGDGKINLIGGEYNPETRNQKGSLWILTGNGNGTFQEPTYISVPNAALSPVVADFNNDGILDIAIASSFSTDITVLPGNGDGTFAAGVNFASAGGVIALVAADFNGDGKIDIAGAGSTGAVSILTNTGP